MSKHHIGSHNNHAHPDGQMRRQHSVRWRYIDKWRVSPTTVQRQIGQKVANAKRRRRDKEETE